MACVGDDFDEAVRNSAGRSLGSSVEVGQAEVPSSYALYPRLSMDTKTGPKTRIYVSSKRTSSGPSALGFYFSSSLAYVLDSRFLLYQVSS